MPYFNINKDEGSIKVISQINMANNKLYLQVNNYFD